MKHKLPKLILTFIKGGILTIPTKHIKKTNFEIDDNNASIVNPAPSADEKAVVNYFTDGMYDRWDDIYDITDFSKLVLATTGTLDIFGSNVVAGHMQLIGKLNLLIHTTEDSFNETFNNIINNYNGKYVKIKKDNYYIPFKVNIGSSTGFQLINKFGSTVTVSKNAYNELYIYLTNFNGG